MRQNVWFLFFLFFGTMTTGSMTMVDAQSPHQAGFEAVADPAAAVSLPELLGDLATDGGSEDDLLDQVIVLEHEVPIAQGEALLVRESFTLRSWLLQPRRAILLLTNTAATSALWRAPADGYDGPAMAARRGYFAFTVDYIGVGDNERAGLDALDSTFERNQNGLKEVVRYIRFRRDVPRVDVVGESWGGAHAALLAADEESVRSVVLSSMSYKATNPMFTSPEFVGMLKSLPDNFLPVDPELLVGLAAGAPDAVKEHIRKSQAGKRVLTTQLWQFQEGLPHFDPGVAKVPGLVVAGPPEAADHQALAADYGGGADYFEIPTAGHAPRLGSPETAAAYWNKVFEFLGSE